MWIVGMIGEAIMSVLPWVLLAGAVAVAAVTLVFGNFLTRWLGLAAATVLFGMAMFYFGADHARDDARVASLRIELAQRTTDLNIARSSIEYWTKQHAEQAAETESLDQKVRKYEADLAAITGDNCALNERDVNRLYDIGR